ncbi:MAG: TonB-dependent receptor [Calditrichaeota bacterium]|nr:MAG: TonB-dependent receptor [Calditrichota bacterium]
MGRFTVIFLILLCAVSLVFSQTTGKISGKVLDADTGEPLPGANVTILGTNMGAAASLEGDYFIINVPPGLYDLRAQYVGFSAVTFTKVNISVNRTTEVSFRLKTAVIEGQEVVIEAPKVQQKKDQTGSIRNVSSQEMNVLPVENTGVVVALQPGVVQGHFRGGRMNETNIMIDGVSVSNGLNRGQMIGVDPDAVQEVEVITGTFSAKYGEAMSGIVNMVTKEGGDRLHGKFEGYLGNYYTSHGDIYMGLKAGEIDRNRDFKFMVDGPIIRNKLSYFVSGRMEDNNNYLNGLRRFNITDEPNYGMFLNETMYDPTTGEYLLNQHTGDSSYVPMDWYTGLNLQGKLTYKAKNVKISGMYLLNQSESQGYSHTNKYKPDGRSRNHSNNNMFTLNLNHFVARNLFYDLKLSYSNSYYGNYVYENPLDLRYIHDRYAANTDYTGFITGGQDKGHYESTTDKYLGRLDLTWQINKNHSIEAGAEGVLYKYDSAYHSILNLYRNTQASNVLYAPEIMPDSSVYTDVYSKKPTQMAFWLSDKMEFDEMVINLGARAEYFDPNTTYPSNYRNPANILQKEDSPEWISTYPKADAKFNVAPRLGLSYALGKTALLRFSYGHFYQYPPHSDMYFNDNYIINPTNYTTTMGNPQVEPEMTVNYEIGLWQELNQYMDLEVALWYKDIYNLSTVNIQTTYNAVRYGLYGNKDYGNARGLELKYKARVAEFFAELNYTLQYTRGNADNPQFTFNRAGNSQDPIPTLIPMPWDQRHTLNMSLGYNRPKWNIAVLGWLGSGSAYTWSPIDQNPLNRVYLLPNNSKKPFSNNFDLKASYDLGAFKDYKIRLTMYVYNLFDHLNENGVNSNTGRTNQAIIRPQDRLGYWSDFSTYEESIYNPQNWSAPRLVKFGIGVVF